MENRYLRERIDRMRERKDRMMGHHHGEEDYANRTMNPRGEYERGGYHHRDGTEDSRRGRRSDYRGDYRGEYGRDGYDSDMRRGRRRDRDSEEHYHDNVRDMRGGEYRGEFSGEYRGDRCGYDMGRESMPYPYNKTGLNTDHAWAEEDDDYDYAKENMDMEYKEDLKKWIKKMKKKDKYGMTEEQVIQKAKSMGADLEEYSETEFYATYLAMLTDYSDVSTDPMVFIKMAIDFLEDEDIKVSPSEKLCIYMYKIVMGEE